MIKFRLEPEPLWISGDNIKLDTTEIGEFPMEERKKLSFKLYPYTPELSREVAEEIQKIREEEGLRGREVEVDYIIMFDRDFQEGILNRVIGDWEGVVDVSDIPVPCNLTNKVNIFDRGYMKLGRALLEVAKEIMAKHDLLVRKSSDGQEKKLDNMQDGSTEDN